MVFNQFSVVFNEFSVVFIEFLVVFNEFLVGLDSGFWWNLKSSKYLKAVNWDNSSSHVFAVGFEKSRTWHMFHSCGVRQQASASARHQAF